MGRDLSTLKEQVSASHLVVLQRPKYAHSMGDIVVNESRNRVSASHLVVLQRPEVHLFQ